MTATEDRELRRACTGHAPVRAGAARAARAIIRRGAHPTAAHGAARRRPGPGGRSSPWPTPGALGTRGSRCWPHAGRGFSRPVPPRARSSPHGTADGHAVAARGAGHRRPGLRVRARDHPQRHRRRPGVPRTQEPAAPWPWARPSRGRLRVRPAARRRQQHCSSTASRTSRRSSVAACGFRYHVAGLPGPSAGRAAAGDRGEPARGLASRIHHAGGQRPVAQHGHRGDRGPVAQLGVGAGPGRIRHPGLGQPSGRPGVGDQAPVRDGRGLLRARRAEFRGQQPDGQLAARLSTPSGPETIMALPIGLPLPGAGRGTGYAGGRCKPGYRPAQGHPVRRLIGAGGVLRGGRADATRRSWSAHRCIWPG